MQLSDTFGLKLIGITNKNKELQANASDEILLPNNAGNKHVECGKPFSEANLAETFHRGVWHELALRWLVVGFGRESIGRPVCECPKG